MYNRVNRHTVLVSGEDESFCLWLEKHGISVIKTKKDERLPKPVMFHSDMQVLVFPKTGKRFILKNCPTMEQFEKYTLSETLFDPQPKYPYDTLCNAKIVGKYVICNPKTIDPTILDYINDIGTYEIVPVKQGYTGCSVCKVSECAVITADVGIARALKETELEVLLIEPGRISLPGYDTGFIGGCSGLIQPDTLVLTGELKFHPNGSAIKALCCKEKVNVLEYPGRPLIDIGGILLLDRLESEW